MIFAACAQGRTDIVQAAIESIRGGESKESSECIRELISSGRAEDSATPLHVASYSGHADVIRALLQAGADLSVTATRGDFLGRRPYEVATSIGKEAYHVFLIEAIVMNDIDRIATLLTGGVPATCADDSTKDTPLHWAASFGNSDIVQVSLSLRICTGGVLFQVEWHFRQLWRSSIILYSITGIAHNQKTNIYLQPPPLHCRCSLTTAQTRTVLTP